MTIEHARKVLERFLRDPHNANIVEHQEAVTTVLLALLDDRKAPLGPGEGA